MEEKIKCPFCGSEKVSVLDGTKECECADCKRFQCGQSCNKGFG